MPRGRSWGIRGRPSIVGILNCTPDSFSDGGLHDVPEVALEAGLAMLRDGADVLDVGGESTRPGSLPVSVAVQIEMICPVLEKLRQSTDAPISVDTRLPEVAAAALSAGADIVNDVSGLREPGWGPVLRNRPVPVIVMHMQGTPETMQKEPSYPKGVVGTVRDFFVERLQALEHLGVSRDRVLLDPGIGFGKTGEDNLKLLRDLGRFTDLGRPIFVGLSRKRFIGRVAEREIVDRDVATVAANAAAVFAGAHVLRVHNVPYTRDLVSVLVAVEQGRPPASGTE